MRSAEDKITSEFGLPLIWKRNTTVKRQSIIVNSDFSKDWANKYNPKEDPVPSRDGWDEYISWMEIYAPKLEKVILERLLMLDLNSLPS